MQITLTDEEVAVISLDGLVPGGGEVELSRDKFEHLTLDLVQRMLGPIKAATQEAGVALGDIPPAEGKYAKISCHVGV